MVLSGTEEPEGSGTDDPGRIWAARKVETDAIAAANDDQEEATVERIDDTASFSLETHHIQSNKDSLQFAGLDSRQFNFMPHGSAIGND